MSDDPSDPTDLAHPVPAADRSFVPLDADALARLRTLDPDGRMGVVQRVLATFDTSLTRMLAQLRAERDAPQPEVLRSVAHQLKSSAAAVGALELAAVCAALEADVRAGGCTDLPARTQRLIDAGERALRAVEAMLRV
jgi:HPt (histidine-containing phosphotransfer) domain-containing protein